MGAGRLRIPASLQEHDPAGRRAAAAVLVLGAALAAAPVLPPDPLEVVHLEHEESDDPEQNLGARHVVQRIGSDLRRAMGREAQPLRPRVLRKGASTGRSSPREGAAPPRMGRYSRAPRPTPPAKRLISQISASTAAMMKSQWITKPALNAMIARIASRTSSSMFKTP